tara:strand:+ start:1709 stop:1891 length:183 start_codon:yes stop_codon:yes gene_type:complete
MERVMGDDRKYQDGISGLFGRSLLRSEMQQMSRQMERLMFEEFRGQQELDSEGEKPARRW